MLQQLWAVIMVLRSQRAASTNATALARSLAAYALSTAASLVFLKVSQTAHASKGDAVAASSTRWVAGWRSMGGRQLGRWENMCLPPPKLLGPGAPVVPRVA